MLKALDDLVESRIRDAQARGEFDGLPGSGRPLPDEDLAGVPPELRVAVRILKNAGCVPAEVGALRDLGLPLQPGQNAPSRDRSSCFATSTSADLIHADGSKRIGSAQLWRGGCLLQHGSILITPQVELWERIFGEEPPLLPALPLGFNDLEALLLRSAARCLPLDCGGVSLVLRDLTPEEWTGVAAKAQGESSPCDG